MAVAAVVFNGTRVNAADNNTNWGHWVGGGAAPAAEAQNAYQNSLAVNKKVTATTLTGIDYDPAAAALDMTAAANKLFFVKIYVADFGDVNATFGVAAGIGSDNANYYVYNMAGSGAKLSRFDEYPAQGGYILAAIDPNIAAWRDSTTGTPVLTAVDWFGGQCAMVVGGAKSENFAVDSIDVGTGLQITAGDGVSTPGKFTDFVAFDQDIKANRYGVVVGAGNGVDSNGLLKIGSASVTEFTDDDSVVTFLDGYHSAGLVGVLVDMGNASSIIVINTLIIGEGTAQAAAADDTRPDFVQTGALGSFDFGGTLRNHRNVEFSSIADIVGASIECELLTQNSCNISDTTIKTNALTSIACLQDPTFGVSTDIHDVIFEQVGAGHAFEIVAATTITLTGIDFIGYGANTTDDAAIDVTATTGTVTINVPAGGTVPTYKTAGATVDIVSSINYEMTGLDAGADVTIVDITTPATPTELFNEVAGVDGIVTYAFDGALTGTAIGVYLRNTTIKNNEFDDVLPSGNVSFPVNQSDDDVYLP